MEDFFASIKNNPVIIGLGVVLLVVGIVILHGQAAQSSPVPAIPSNPSTTGGTADTSSQNGGPGTSGTNVFYSNPVVGPGVPGPAGPAGPAGPSGPTGSPGPSVHIEPSPKNTPGMSNNFWVYTTGKADTLKYINDNVGKWGKFGPGYLVGYRNNLQVLQSWGVDTSNYTKVLPSGMRLSV